MENKLFELTRKRRSVRRYGSEHIDDEIIKVEVNGGQGPCIIKPVEGDKYIYLILPIRR